MDICEPTKYDLYFPLTLSTCNYCTSCISFPPIDLFTLVALFPWTPHLHDGAGNQGIKEPPIVDVNSPIVNIIYRLPGIAFVDAPASVVVSEIVGRRTKKKL